MIPHDELFAELRANGAAKCGPLASRLGWSIGVTRWTLIELRMGGRAEYDGTTRLWRAVNLEPGIASEGGVAANPEDLRSDAPGSKTQTDERNAE